MIERQEFLNPAMRFRVNPMMHSWASQPRSILMDAVKDFGFGGVVTNPDRKKGTITDEQSIEELSEVIKELEERGLQFWLYDEQGYPSGAAGGRVLKDHSELEAKGFYMRRRIVYPPYGPKHCTFRIDEESDKIVWAAKYPVNTERMNDSFVEYEKMEPIPFTDEFCECYLEENQAMFVFCSKPAYEGSHCTHNVSSFLRYINVMDPKAVRRFIDIAYEPIYERIPDAYKKAVAVFTDEPSLQVTYARPYEIWAYALAPWVDGLFEAFEKEYGYSMLPYLPMLFEGDERAYSFRIQFYNLVGKLIARAYSGQLAAWCREKGGVFSGHYIGEEYIYQHVEFYGNYLEVMKAAGYPGIDVLHCYPEIYIYNTAKYVQMVVRKKGINGMMVEICPFRNREIFAQDPVENMTGVMGLLYLGGVRRTNSYFRADFNAYDKRINAPEGYMNQQQAIAFNEYVGRLGYMLDQVLNDCNIFVYYGLEDAQAKMVPQYTSLSGRVKEADASTDALTKKIIESGYDFYYADSEDLINAKNSLDNGKPMISGCEVKVVIVPALDVMYDEAIHALKQLKESGVTVLFLDKVPQFGTSDAKKEDFLESASNFESVDTDCVMDCLDNLDEAFSAKTGDAMLIKGKFVRDGHEMYFVDNNTRGVDAEVVFDHKVKKHASIYNPVDGSVTPIMMGEKYTIPSFRGVFVVFD